ncbi:AAA family ATPase [Calidifontibacter indicus]|uniref:AAA family ATPase n=1 Tax=Calidifontibacter indicus TaxID=419650 RepID=UPI003D708DCE
MSPGVITVITGVTARAEADLATVLGSAAGLDLVRRCADLAEVVSVAAAGRAQVALISVDLPGLDRSVLSDLAGYGVRVVGVHADEADERTLREWGVPWLVPEHADEAEVLDRVRAAASETVVPARKPGDPLAAETVGVTADGGDRSVASDQPAAVDESDPNDRHEPGKVIVVWGTGGAPGRSVLAAGLAAELAAAGEATLLVDADTYGACQAQMFGILDEAPGIAAAARLAEAGRLDTVSLGGVAPLINDRLRVLTGLPRADRWPEIRTAALERVLEVARSMHRWTIVDVAAPTDLDEELSYDTLAPQRNMATRAVLDAADEVIVVASGDPIGLGRLVQALDQLTDFGPATRTVVVNKVRASAAGRHPEDQITEALHRFSGVTPALLPDDRDALDAALLAGRTVTEASPSAPLSQAIRDLANQRLGLPTTGRSGSRRRGILRRTG